MPPTMTSRAGVALVVLLLAGPALLVAIAPRIGFVCAAASVAVLVYLVLRNERRGGPGSPGSEDSRRG